MALDFTALQTEVFARGFDYLNDGGAGLTRMKRWINDAMHEIDDMEEWDYTLTTVTGVAPLTISDLNRVESVVDVVHRTPLEYQDRTSLVDEYADLTLTGQPYYWYRTSPTVLATYPVNTSVTFTVRYHKFGPDLSAGSDTPLMPDRFRPVIIEKAAAKAYRDSNAIDAANDCLTEANRLLEVMRSSLWVAPARQALTEGSQDS